MASQDIVIKVNNLSKKYKTGQIGIDTLSGDLTLWWKKLIGKHRDKKKDFPINEMTKNIKKDYIWALKDINFEIHRGEIIGIIGRNGAGKSTLLKLLSNIIYPSTGIIKAEGPIASLLEVGTGFHPELTGRENIYLNGTILGMTRQEINKKIKQIIDFSEVKEFIDTPIKRYSSGMVVRLGFAVAVHLEPNILIVDEVLSVGDESFQQKAIEKIRNISQEKGKTVLFVSHNMRSVKSICKKGILLNKGKIEKRGEIDDVINHYIGGVQTLSNHYINNSPKKKLAAYLSYVKVVNSQDVLKNLFFTTDNIQIEVKICINKLISKEGIYLLLKDEKMLPIMTIPYIEFNKYIKIIDTEKIFLITLPANFFTQGTYFLDACLYSPGRYHYEEVINACSFRIKDLESELAQLQLASYEDRGVILPKYSIETL